MKILAYSDIHYHQYTNGLTLKDISNIELDIIELVRTHNPNVVIFCGDRYVSRNPHYEVIFEATKTLHHILKSISIPFIYLVGNHCQTLKNHKGLNTAEHLNFSGYPNLHVVSTKRSLNVGYGSIMYHCVPAGTENDPYQFQINKNGINIALYHGMIKNAKYDSDIVNTDGHDCSFLDNPKFDLVICGDNHRHQKLEMFKNTEAWYVGATAQHKWSETGTKRGYMLFDVDKPGPNESAIIKTAHIESKAPKFKIYEMTADDSVYGKLTKLADDIQGSIVKLIINGVGQDLENLDLGVMKEYIYKIGAVHAEVRPNYLMTETVQTTTSSENKSYVDMWNELLTDKKDDLTDFDLDQIKTLGEKYINDRNTRG